MANFDLHSHHGTGIPGGRLLPLLTDALLGVQTWRQARLDQENLRRELSHLDPSLLDDIGVERFVARKSLAELVMVKGDIYGYRRASEKDPPATAWDR